MFLRRCRLKNLSARTQAFYKEELAHFQTIMPELKFVDEITQDALDAFVIQEMERKNRTTTINTRLRGIYAFLRFCFEQEYHSFMKSVAMHFIAVVQRAFLFFLQK